MEDMNITSAQWVTDLLSSNNQAAIKFTVDGEELCVTNNATGNRHYDEIMRQVATGDLTIADAD